MSNFEIASRLLVELNEVKPCCKKLTAKLLSEELSKGLENQSSEIAKIAELPGFRKGKAPVSIVKSRFSAVIKDEFKRELMSKILERLQSLAIDEKSGFDILNYALPKLEEVVLEEGKDFNVSFELEVAPDIKLSSYSDIKIELQKEEVKEEEISEQIDILRDNYGKYSDCEGPVVENDMLEVVISSDFHLPEGASDEAKRLVKCDNMWVWVRSPEMIPGLNKAVIGLKVGETSKFTAEYPANFREKVLAGKTLEYTVTINKLQRHGPLSDNEELCKALSVANIDELKEKIKKELESAKKANYEYALKEKYIDDICAKTSEFPLPEKMLNQFIADETNSYLRSNVANEEQAEEFQKNKEQYIAKIKEDAIKRLRRFLIVKKIARQEDIHVENADIDAELNKISKYYRIDRKTIEKNFSDRMAEHLYMKVLEEKVKDMLLAKNTPSKEEKQST